MGHRGGQAVWGEHDKGRSCSRKHVGTNGCTCTIERPGRDRQETWDMQGERGWSQGRDEGRALTRVCSSESPVSAAMRHSVVGSGCLFTLQKWYSRISSCSSVGITGFSMAISSWGRAMGPGTAERGQCHCSSWEWPVGPHLLSPRFAIRVPTGLPPPAVASGCSRAQLPSQRHARELSWERQPPSYCCLSFLSAASTRQQCPALSCLTILSWQEAAGCSALPWCCIYSQSDSHGNDSCLQPYLGLGVT